MNGFPPPPASSAASASDGAAAATSKSVSGSFLSSDMIEIGEEVREMDGLQYCQKLSLNVFCDREFVNDLLAWCQLCSVFCVGQLICMELTPTLLTHHAACCAKNWY